MSRTKLVVSGFVLVAGLLWWVAMSEPRGATHGNPAEPAASRREPETQEPFAAPAPEAQRPHATREQAPLEPPKLQLPTESLKAAPPSEQSPERPAQPEVPRREGPVDELKALFAAEPRDSAAPRFESKIDAAFRHEGVPAALFKSVLCRETICKIELRWTPERSMGYMIGMTLVSSDFDKAPPAIDPVGEPAADGTVSIDVYWPRPAALR